MARDRADAEKRRRRRKVSPTSSNSGIEGLAKEILAGHLAQMSVHQCNHQAPTEPSFRSRQRWQDFDCTRAELFQRSNNFFKYWFNAMSLCKENIKEIRDEVFKKGGYDINMLIDSENGMTLEVSVDYFHQTPGMLSHLRRKVHDWLKDYTGSTKDNLEAIQRHAKHAVG